jgi:hypothetical protein
MAQSGDSYFSNAIVGVPQVGADVNIYDQHDKPRFALGTKFERQDGAIFRYVHFGAAITSAGLVLAQDQSENGMALTSACVLTSSSTYQMPDDPLGVYPNTKGSKYMIITKSSIAADDFAGAYVAATSATTPNVVGQTYRIKGNTATGTPVASNFRAELYDRLQTTIGSAGNLVIVGCKFSNLEAASYINTDGAISGVSILSSGTSYPYGWIQTRGIVCVKTDASLSASYPMGGRTACLSTQEAGTVQCAQLITAGTNIAILQPIVGTFVLDGSASSYAFVDVNIM